MEFCLSTNRNLGPRSHSLKERWNKFINIIKLIKEKNSVKSEINFFTYKINYCCVLSWNIWKIIFINKREEFCFLQIVPIFFIKQFMVSIRLKNLKVISSILLKFLNRCFYVWKFDDLNSTLKIFFQKIHYYF